jgi:hypothetical protein
VAANRHADAAPQPSGNRDPALDADVPPDLPVKQQFGMSSDDPTAARPAAGTGLDLPHARPVAADSRGGLEARQAMLSLESVS